MALPKRYLTTQKNLDGVLSAIQSARAPAKFTQQFLAGLGFKSSSDRLIIGVLKSIGFLTEDGVPTQRYFDFLDQTQGPRVLAEGVMEAYADLFEINTSAHKMKRDELKNKMRTLSQGQFTDSVLDKMALTFTALAKNGDFDAAISGSAEGGQPPPPEADEDGVDGGESVPVNGDEGSSSPMDEADGLPSARGLDIHGLVYNIQIQLPESRDPKVYDALFESLAKHLRG